MSKNSGRFAPVPVRVKDPTGAFVGRYESQQAAVKALELGTSNVSRAFTHSRGRDSASGYTFTYDAEPEQMIPGSAWLDIPGKPWRASCWGQIKDIATDTLIQQTKGKDCYVFYTEGGKTIRCNVDFLVCMAWNAPRPTEDLIVIHIDRKRHNNNSLNLRWGLKKEKSESAMKATKKMSDMCSAFSC